MTTIRSSVSFVFEELLPLFAADTCALLPLVGKRFTPPSNPDSFWISFLNPSDDLRYQPVIVVLSSTDRAGDAPIFIF